MVDKKRELLDKIARVRKRWNGCITCVSGLLNDVIEDRVHEKNLQEGKGLECSKT